MSYMRSPWPASPLSGLDDEIERELTRSGGKLLSTAVDESARLVKRGVTAATPKVDPKVAKAAAAEAAKLAKAAAGGGGATSSPLVLAAGVAAVIGVVALVAKKIKKRRA